MFFVCFLYNVVNVLNKGTATTLILKQPKKLELLLIEGYFDLRESEKEREKNQHYKSLCSCNVTFDVNVHFTYLEHIYLHVNTKTSWQVSTTLPPFVTAPTSFQYNYFCFEAFVTIWWWNPW